MSSNELVPVRHGRFVIEVPEGWADESTLSFVAPIQQALTARLSPKKPPSFASNVHVTMEELPEGVTDPAAFLQIMGEGLQTAGVELEDVGPPQAFSMSGREAALVERKVVLNNEAVRQLTAVCFVPPNVIVASASTSESEIERERPQLREVLSRIRFE